MKRRQPKTLAELCVLRGGLRKGSRAMTMIAAWALVRASVGRELGDGQLTAAIAEYSAYWKQSERTSWRELAAFREVFPEHESPAPIAEQLAPRMAAAAEMIDSAAAKRDQTAALSSAWSISIDGLALA